MDTTIATSNMFQAASIATAVSFALSALIVLTQRWHGQLTFDEGFNFRKFHKIPTPRVGGIALVVGIVMALIWGPFNYPHLSRPAHTEDLGMLLLAGMPAFLAGLAEDLTRKISVKTRLLATFASPLLACWLLGAYLPRLDIWGLDDLLHQVPLAIAVTAVLVAGVANSINIIDGFHGVAGSAVIIMLGAMGLLCWQSGDAFVLGLALVGIGTTLGFFVVNYPTGRLFMGDGGAYFLGFWLAEVAVLTVVRNREISAWQVLAVCIYPVIEVLYSIYRRGFVRKVSSTAPDRLHLHTLIYRRVVCQHIGRDDHQPWIRNAAVACIVSAWIATTTLIALWAGSETSRAVVVVVGEVLLYMAIYRRLVRGRWSLKPGTAVALQTKARSRT